MRAMPIPVSSTCNRRRLSGKQATFESIGQFYHSRLKTIFPAVAPNPKNLVNSSNNPIFQLHFAAGNERGGKIAMKIAKHILDHV